MGTMVRGWPRLKLPMRRGAEMEKRRWSDGVREGNSGEGEREEDIQGMICAMRRCKIDA